MPDFQYSLPLLPVPNTGENLGNCDSRAANGYLSTFPSNEILIVD